MMRSLPALTLAALVWIDVAAQTSERRPAMVIGEPAREHAAAAPYATLEYAYDDGTGNVNIGPPSTFDPDMLWGNYFFTQPDGGLITEMSVAFGPTFPSSSTGPVTFWLVDDPDADGDPRTNAAAVRSVDATPDVFGNTFYHVQFAPPAAVSGAFFVGASAQLLGGQDRPARVDTDGRADRSWFCYAPDIAAVIDSLAAAPFCTRMDDGSNVPFPGAFMIRAVGEPVVGTEPRPATGVDLQVSPNPIRRSATLRLSLMAPARAEVHVFDALGRVVATPVDGDLAAGVHELAWDAGALAPGVYVTRLRAGSSVVRARIAVVR